MGVPHALSLCHTKRRTGTRGRARPSFGMTPTLYNFWGIFFLKIFDFFITRPSFFWYDNDTGHYGTFLRNTAHVLI